MRKLVVCAANFSEGQRLNVVADIAAAIDSARGAALLGWECDADHNRAVVTFAGEPPAVMEAAYRGIQAACDLIDIRQHHGQHPRVGAADVIPFVPMRSISMGECAAMARELGGRVARELRIPVFLYGHAACQNANRELADIRRGGIEALRDRIASGEGPRPDFGPRQLGKAGACVIGARDILIAFNVSLATADIAIAKSIARSVRESSGGLPCVKALGFLVGGKAQVSMNLTDYRVTSIHRAVDAVRQAARAYGLAIDSTELIGLLPQAALHATDDSFVRIDNFSLDRVLEVCLARHLR